MCVEFLDDGNESLPSTHLIYAFPVGCMVFFFNYTNDFQYSEISVCALLSQLSSLHSFFQLFMSSILICGD
jgi:hypothetical protein